MSLRPRSPFLILLLRALWDNLDHYSIVNINACCKAVLECSQSPLSMQISHICCHMRWIPQLFPGDRDIADWILRSDAVSVEQHYCSCTTFQWTCIYLHSTAVCSCPVLCFTCHHDNKKFLLVMADNCIGTVPCCTAGLSDYQQPYIPGRHCAARSMCSQSADTATAPDITCAVKQHLHDCTKPKCSLLTAASHVS